MEEAVSGVKELATKVYGDDLKVLEEKADQIVGIMRGVKGIEDLGVFRVLGHPNLNVTVDRDRAARYQINVAGVQEAIQTAVGERPHPGAARRSAVRPGDEHLSFADLICVDRRRPRCTPPQGWDV